MVYILLGNGFEEMEAVAPSDILRRAGVETRFVGVSGAEVTGNTGLVVKADMSIDEVDRESLEMVIIPGGLRGVRSLGASKEAAGLIKYAFDSGRMIAAICAGPMLLARLGILDGRRAVCYPDSEIEEELSRAKIQKGERVVVDGKIITAVGPGAAVDFGLKLVEIFRGKQTSQDIRAAIVYDR